MTPNKTRAAGLDTRAALQNTQLDYAPVANLIQANIDGQRLAKAFLSDLQNSYADPDAMYLAIKSIEGDGQHMEALATLRGFARILQKALERSAA
jgi:hypothetical protein